MVKPQISTLLERDRVPKKSVFSRTFNGFAFLGKRSRCPAPKPSALPTALHPENLYYFIFDLSATPSKIVVATQSYYIITKESIKVNRYSINFIFYFKIYLRDKNYERPKKNQHHKIITKMQAPIQL